MIRYIKNILSVGILIGIMTACEDLKFGNNFLEKPLGEEISIDTIFSRKIYAEQALNQFYKSLPDFMPTASSGCRPEGRILDLYSDLGYNSGIPWVSGILHSGMAGGGGSFPYNLWANSEIMGSPRFGIRKAYIYLENIDRVPDMTVDEKRLRKAEAKVVIATHYLLMIRFLGGVPWMDHAYKADETFEFPRMTFEETVNKTVVLLDEAAADLPWYTTDEEYGHMTAAAALALKFRLRLFAASPLFNATEPYCEGQAATEHLMWYGDYQEERWRDALNAGIEFLRLNKQNGDYYRIENTDHPREDYLNGYFVKGNREVIMPTFREGLWESSSKFFRIYAERNQTRASYADMFQWKDGTKFDWKRVKDENDKYYAQPFFDKDGIPNRDIRLYETLMINGDQWTGSTKLQVYDGGKHGYGTNSKVGNRTMYGYGYRKFIQNFDDGGDLVYKKPYSCPWIRIPEIYLNMAEAMNHLNIANQKDEFGMDAYNYLNLVHTRAGMLEITASKVPPGTDLLNFLLDERAREFGQEDVRYYDMVRYKKGYEWTTRPVEKLQTIKEKDGSFTYIPKVSDEQYMWKDHWYLFPFPIAEINKKYGLIQNPGWE